MICLSLRVKPLQIRICHCLCGENIIYIHIFGVVPLVLLNVFYKTKAHFSLPTCALNIRVQLVSKICIEIS